MRVEDKIEVLKIDGLAFGSGVKSRVEFQNGKATNGFESKGERDAPPMDTLLKQGFAER